ncbi:PAS domain S-box protein [Hymenobacter taeanensis]|uniref:Sensory/regulatory protein RpfC n=1 Tax=Hymenobacter taeanensis TaxID=2735321 RepID=A0A6M6BE92_9BACT|nr:MULTISPECIES: PAS domain S-box protein [Hymenobacter]QJX46252.1 PAS domain S-box protein [Hymenobacter taeanensis]UOQ80106.1 PAS domain S-box protein [Hymenobacter sp. 5414T-23]
MKPTTVSSPPETGKPDFALLEEIFDAVVLLTAEGTLTWVNAGFGQLTGFHSPEQAPGLLVGALAEVGITPAAFQRQLQAGPAPQFEVPLRRANGQGVWVHVKLRPYPPTGTYLGLLEDITTRQHAALEQEERFRYLTENVPGVLFQWRESLTGGAGLSYISPQLHTIFGIAPEQAQEFIRFVHPDDQAQWESSLKLAKQHTGGWLFEGRLVVPGQPVRWCRGTAQLAESSADGALYSGILTDITALKLAEETVQANERRWRLAMERFGDGAWEFNYQTNEEYFSKAYYTMLGYSDNASDPPLTSWLHHVHPDDQGPSLEAAGAYLRGEVPIYSVERRLRCRDGQYKWVLTRGLVTQRDEQGEPLIMTGVHTDISAVKQATAALEASMLRFSTTIANFQEGIMLEDEHQRVVLANAALCRIFNLDIAPDQLINYDTRLLSQAIQEHFRYPEEFVARYETIVRERQLVTAELFELADGRTVQGDFVPIFVAERYIGNLWKFQDITERKNSDDALRRREEKYRGIIEKMHLGLIEMDFDNRVLFTNQTFQDTTGFSDQELAEEHIMAQLLSAEELTKMNERNSLRLQGISETYELPITTKTGQAKWLLVSAAPLYNDHRQVYGSIGIFLDITHQKQLESRLRKAKEQAEESARAKELFLANMSHEIRTPMNAILGMGQLLAKTPLNDDQHTYLRAIATSGENLLVILNDILDLSKIGASQLLIENIGFSITGLLHQIEQSLHFKAEEKGLSFHTQADERIPTVLLGDPYRITQVLLNLAGNSVKFTEKGSVTVSCTLEQATETYVDLRFLVADTGIGIDAEYLEDIFNEFSQEDSSVTRKFGGTGLGLSISRQLVHLMGGEISIDSQKHEGTHSNFTLRLSIGAPEDLPQKTLVTASIREQLRNQRILLVEDNNFNRQIAKGFLRNAGLEVVEAENGAIAVELVQQQPFAAVLMDVQMPIMNGLEATAYLRQELNFTTPIIALTANAIKGEREKCLEAGMNDYLPKPFQEDDLLKMLCRWILPEAAQEALLTEATVGTEPNEADTLPFYNLDIVRKIGQGDASFTVLMLESFIEGCTEAVQELQAAATAHDVVALRSATHKLKPSLEHLQVNRLLPLITTLDSWHAAFDDTIIPSMVAEAAKLLQQLIEQMTQELHTLRAELE